MKVNFKYRLIAKAIFLVHALVLIIALFGWLVPSLWYAYLSVLVLILFSDLIFGYCILSKWEFDFRKKMNPSLDYKYSWTTYYTYRFTQHLVSENFIEVAARIFIVASLVVNIYFYYFR